VVARLKDDEWDPPPSEPISHYGVAGDQMKRDIADGKLDDVLRQVEEDIKASAGSARCREVQNASAILESLR
jgi:hypothetical protein